MTDFNPLREGFRELNNLLTDRQTFNAQNEANEAKRVRDNTLLASQLEDRAFGRAMAEKKMVMSEDLNKFQRDMANKKFEEGKAQFDVDSDINAQRLKMQQENAQSTRAYNDALKNKAEFELKQKEEWAAPRPVVGLLEGSGWKNVPDDIKQEVVEIVGGHHIDRDDDIVDINGDTINMSPQRAAQLAPLVKGKLVDYTSNVQKNALARVNEINTEISNLQGQMAKSATSASQDVRNVANNASTKVQMEALRKELKEQQLQAGPPGARLDLETKINRKSGEIQYKKRLGLDSAAAEAEHKAMLDQRKAMNLALAGGGKKGSGKTKTVYVGKVGKNGDITDIQMMTVDTDNPTATKPPEGFSFLEDYNIKKQGDSDAYSTFRQSSLDIFHDKLVPNMIDSANTELHSGHMLTMERMRQASLMTDKEFAKVPQGMKAEVQALRGMTMQQIATRGRFVHAQGVKHFLEKRDKLLSANISEEDRQTMLDELNADAENAFGTVPSIESYERLKELHQLSDTKDLEPPKNSRSGWGKFWQNLKR